MMIRNCSWIILACILVMQAHTILAGAEVWIATNSPAVTNATGTPSAPYQCPDGESLAAVLAALPEYSTIHFLPGTFLVTNWIDPKIGWKLHGAGINNTVLKLLPHTVQPGGGKVAVIGGIYGYIRKDNVEVTDMTIDCNLQNQGVAIVAQAVGLAGNNTRISRVRAINWGSTRNSYECFVLAISGHPDYGARTNCVIQDSVVDTPAPIIHSDGTTAISIFTSGSEYSSAPFIYGAQVHGNLVSGVTTGNSSGKPAYFHAYAVGAYSGVVRDNQAVNIIGGNGFYQDTWSGSDVVICNNVFENVSVGINFNMTEYNLARVKIIGNMIMPPEGGYGISYYSGEPGSVDTNAYAKHLLIKDNVVHPFRSATNLSAALSLAGDISASIVNNIFDSGGGSDLVAREFELEAAAGEVEVAGGAGDVAVVAAQRFGDEAAL